MSNLAALRQLLEQRYPDAAPLTRGVAVVPTGIAPLDAILPGGGLPRGKLIAWHSEGGAAAVLRAACRAVVAAGERAAWIDGAGVLSLTPGAIRGALILRPAGPLEALQSAEVLLRSGGLTLVVLAEAEPEGAAALRLTRAAREGGAALVTLARHVAVAGLRISSRLLTQSYQWTIGPFGDPAIPQEVLLEIRIRTLGGNTRTTIALPVLPYELRLSPDSERADRRGAGRRVRRA